MFVGTSGWLYSWNTGGSLDWYVENSGLNAVELNASFYRTPYRGQVLSWSRKGSGLRWSIKIHRYISHTKRLGQGSLEAWTRFREVFRPMDRLIDFYLLQLPPTYRHSTEALDRLREFIEGSGERDRLAVEFRHETWFQRDWESLCRELGVSLVSVDSPETRWVVSCRDTVYLRLHGRGSWYLYEYSREELEELAREVADLSPRRVYVFFNNNHWMLENARTMLEILRGL